MKCIPIAQGIPPSTPIPSPSAILFLFRLWWRDSTIAISQLAPLDYKEVKILSKFAELADVEITLRHIMHLFMPTFYRRTMLNIRHRGSKFLIFRMDDKGSQ